MTPDEIVESIDRHYLVGCVTLNREQLESHERDGACFECIARASIRIAASAVAGADNNYSDKLDTE